MQASLSQLKVFFTRDGILDHIEQKRKVEQEREKQKMLYADLQTLTPAKIRQKYIFLHTNEIPQLDSEIQRWRESYNKECEKVTKLEEQFQEKERMLREEIEEERLINKHLHQQIADLHHKINEVKKRRRAKTKPV